MVEQPTAAADSSLPQAPETSQVNEEPTEVPVEVPAEETKSGVMSKLDEEANQQELVKNAGLKKDQMTEFKKDIVAHASRLQIQCGELRSKLSERILSQKDMTYNEAAYLDCVKIDEEKLMELLLADEAHWNNALQDAKKVM